MATKPRKAKKGEVLKEQIQENHSKYKRIYDTTKILVGITALNTLLSVVVLVGIFTL